MSPVKKADVVEAETGLEEQDAEQEVATMEEEVLPDAGFHRGPSAKSHTPALSVPSIG